MSKHKSLKVTPRFCEPPPKPPPPKPLKPPCPPKISPCKNLLGGKRVALFGSYGWGDGEWMRTWESDCDSAGVNLVCESVICTETPDDAALEACRALGKALVE